MIHNSKGFPGETGVVTRKRRKGIYILPNLFTLAALFGGFYAVVMAMDGRFDQAAIGIFCAMVLGPYRCRSGHQGKYEAQAKPTVKSASARLL